MEPVTLSNGVKMPRIGLGTYLASPDEAYQAVRWALEIGYRHIDTAAYYANEEAIGTAVKDSGIPREEIFITTKLWFQDHRRARAAGKESLKRLGMDYVDLYLIHWPMPGYEQAWKILQELYKEGKAKAIGVSNFLPQHLAKLDARPMVNQFEISPFLNQKALIAHCRKLGIQVEAYSPLTRADRLDDDRIVHLAGKTGHSPAQLMLRWSIQKGNVVLPKSVTRYRIEENFRLDFTLDKETMEELDSMDEGFRKAPDPAHIEERYGGGS